MSKAFGIAPPHRVSVELEDIVRGFLTDGDALLQLQRTRADMRHQSRHETACLQEEDDGG